MATVWEDPPPVPPTPGATISPSTSSSIEERTNDEEDEKSTEEGDLLKALYDYKGEDDDDLSFSVGDVVRVIEYCDGGWAKAFLGDQYGYIPSSYFERLNTEV